MTASINALAERRVRPRVARTEVSVTGLKVDADIGVFEAEMVRRQQLVIDATLRVCDVANDELDQTFDYNQLQDFALELAGQRTALIETFAKRLAERCLEVEQVEAVDITIWKPTALTNGMARTRICIERP